MRQFYCKKLFALAALALTAAVASAQDTRLHRHSETLGDVMGDTPMDVVSAYTKNYYDSSLRMQSTAQYGRMYDDTGYMLARYTRYEYDEAGRVLKTWSNQYGRITDKDMGFKESNDTTWYTYNDLGQLVEEKLQRAHRTTYTYDEEGNCVKKLRNTINWLTGAESWSSTTEYSDFVDGKPTKYATTDPWNPEPACGEIIYDEQGRKVQENHYSAATGKLKEVEYWHYDETGFLTLSERKNVNSAGVESDNHRTVYFLDNGNPDRVCYYGESISGERWIKDAPTKYINVYADYAGQQAPTLSATQGAHNTVTLTIGLPDNAKADCGGVVVMDFGVVMDTISIQRAAEANWLAADGKTITYDPVNQLNGSHEYMVQYVELDEDRDSLANEWLVSDPVALELFTDLPAPRNVRVVEVANGQYGYDVTVEWDAPEGVENYDFVRYNAINSKYKVADNWDDIGQSLSWTFREIETEFTFYIQAVYTLGKANTDYITINPRDYLSMNVDSRMMVEEVVTFDDAAQPALKTINFYNGADQLMRRATYTVGEDGADVLTAYTSFEFAEGEDELTATQFHAITGDEKVLVERTYNDYKKVATEKVWNADKTENIETQYTYNDRAVLTGLLVKQNKVRNSGSVTSTNLYNIEYTEDAQDNELMNGVRYDFVPATAQWKQVATVKRLLMAPANTYAPTAEALSETAEGVVISAKPNEMRINAIGAFTIYVDGAVAVRGAHLFDEAYVQESELGEFLGWCYTVPVSGLGLHEYIVQFGELGDDMTYRRGYSCAPVFTFLSTPVASAAAAPAADGKRYNLQGQRVAGGYKGIVIKNGNKYINK